MKFTCKTFVVVLLFTGSLLCQDLGSIKGKLIDKITKQPLYGVNVYVISNNNTATIYGAVSDLNGEYSIYNVPENIYKLKISMIGYETWLESDVRVIRGKAYSVREIELVETTITQNEVVVSSGYFNDQKEMPVSNYNYTREEIIRAPGAMGDIFRAVETLPGVSTSGGEFSAFSVRGDQPRNNLVLIDNIPFAETSHFSETGGDLQIQGGRWNIFSQGLIDKADFQSGGFSSKYGGKRASLLNLSIKEGNKESPTLIGSADLSGLEIKYDGPTYLMENSGLLLSVRKVDFATVMKMIGEEQDGNSKFTDIILKTTFELNRYNKISLLGIYSTENHFRDLNHYFKGDSDDILDRNDLEMSDQTEDKTLLGLNWRCLTGTKGFFNTSIYFSQVKQYQVSGEILIDPIYNRMPLPNEISTRYPVYIYDINENQIGFKTDFNYSLSKLYSINAGIAIQRLSGKSSAILYGKDTVYVFNTTDKPKDNFLIVSSDDFNSKFDRSRMEYAAYLETMLSLTDRLNLNLGARYDYDDVCKINYFSPRISGSYKIDAATSMNFAAGIYYESPAIRQISLNEQNLSLKNEKSYQIIFGVTHYLTDDIKLNAESYYKKLENLIVEPNINVNYYGNTGEGYSYGIDLSLIKKFVNNFYGQVNYSYSQCKIKENPSLQFHYSDFNQPHMFNFLLGWQLNDNWSFSVKWKYATGRPKDEYIIHANVLNDPDKMRYSKEITSINSQRLGDYHSLNFRVDYRKQFTSHLAAGIYIDIMNLYNRGNEVSESFKPVIGMNKYWSLGMIPTIGVKLEI
jgi:hypothetical protein